MKRTKSKRTPIDQLMEAVGNGLTPALAKQILAIKSDKKHQTRMQEYADRCTEGELTPEEYAEYGMHVRMGTELAILKSRARLLLSQSAEHEL